MQTLTLTLPENLEVDRNEILMIVATRLYDQGKLSLGQAAELVQVLPKDRLPNF